MTQRTLRRVLSAAAVCTALPVLAPAVAPASTWTVDDDRVQCPAAAFTSIQAAVDQAAPQDVIVVCDGLYEEQSTPASGNGSPSQAGSLNGLTITKPLTIRGAGAGKVTIRPKPQPGGSLAGTAPFLRDGGGNVVTISRQSRDATDVSTMFVDISGVTIDSPATYAEAAVAFFNTSGAIRDSQIGPLPQPADPAELAARPHGWGVVATTYQVGAEAGPRHEVSVLDSLVTGYQAGGVLFDDARGADGSPDTLASTGIPLYGFLTGTSVIGNGPEALVPQTGVQFHAGARGAIRASSVRGNYLTADPRRSVGVLLTGAATGIDPANSAQRAFSLSDSVIAGNGWGMFNAGAANDAVRLGAPAAASLGVTGTESFWGCSAGPVIGAQSSGSTATSCQGVSGADTGGAASVQLGYVRSSAPPLATVPGTTDDDAPVAAFSEPFGGEIVAGEPFAPTVAARDDFGVRSVSVTLDGAPLGSTATAPYEFAGWTPEFDELGESHTLETTVVDSAGQETTVTTTATVVAPDGYRAITVTPAPVALGAVFSGSSVTQPVTVANSGQNPLTLDVLTVAGAGFTAAGGSCAAATTLAPGASCTVAVAFAPQAAGTAAGTLTVAATAVGGVDPIVVPLSGSGVAPPVDPPPAQTAPVNTAPPAVTGRGLVGATLHCTPGSWSGAPSTYAVTWLRDGTPISAGATYTPVVADTGTAIACRVTAANAAGVSAPATAPAVRVAFATRTTKTTVAKQAGAAVVTFATTARVGRDGRLALARVVCGRAGRCAVSATGTLKAGGRTFPLTARTTLAAGARGTLTVTLGASARRALRAADGTVKVKVTSRGSRTGAATAKVTVKRG